MNSRTTAARAGQAELPPTRDEMPELELSDEDILDAMREIPGYLDITTDDFRTLYHHAHRHALARLFEGVIAGRLMHTGIVPLERAQGLDAAVEQMARQGLKSLPVTDPERRVLGILSETDVLRAVGAKDIIDLLDRLSHQDRGAIESMRTTQVGEVMTSPALTLPQGAGFGAIMAVFATHGGRSTPVVDAEGRLSGLLLRRDVLSACHLDAVPWI